MWNQSAQIKHIWKLIQEKQTLWAKWVASTKLKRLSFWGITKATDNSWNLKNLLKLRKTAKPLVSYQLWDGKAFLFGLTNGAMASL